MTKPNEENERIKRRYLAYLREARRCSESTIDAAAAAIDRFDVFQSRKPFKTFHRERAMAFKRRLIEQRGAQSGKPLSQSTLDSTLRALVAFFKWLAAQPGYKSRFTYTDAEHFHLALADARAGRAHRPRSFPTIEQLHHVLSTMPSRSDVEKRNRALLALTLLTCARDGALRTLRLKHLRLDARQLVQDPREVATKFSKMITTTFFPVGGAAEAIVSDWAAHLTENLKWGPDDPLFPQTRVTVGSRGVFEATGLQRKFWSTTSPVRAIFRDAFAMADLPYFHPHSFRHTLSTLGTRLCRSPEELKAWSQNLGHSEVLTTLMSYGAVPDDRQSALMALLSGRSLHPARDTSQEVAQLMELALAKLKA